MKLDFLKYLNEKTLVKHQIDSYNDFVVNRLQRIINDIEEIKPELLGGEDLVIKLGRISVEEPIVKEADGSIRKILPSEARTRNLTYASRLRVTMTPVFEGVKQDSEKVIIGEIPVMVKSIICPTAKMNKEELEKSGEDPDDPGGYFIINGSEKVIVTSEELANNQPMYLRDLGEEIARLNSERRGYVQRHVFRRKHGIIYLNFANVKSVPAVVVMRALGMETDKEIIEAISEKYAGEVYLNIYESEVSTKEEAVDVIGKKASVTKDRESRVYTILDKYLLPHLGQDPEIRKLKAEYLGKIIKNLVALAKGDLQEDDIDHYANKRSVFLGKWGFVARIKYNFQKSVKRGRMPSLQSTVVADTLTKQIMSAMATGSWVGGRTGVAQRLERSNFLKALDHLRNVVSPLSSQRQHFEARELHATQWGRLCPIKTPEGMNIGLRKYLASFALITNGIPEKERTPLKEVLLKNLKEGEK